jgi:hypothetical protein
MNVSVPQVCKPLRRPHDVHRRLAPEPMTDLTECRLACIGEVQPTFPLRFEDGILAGKISGAGRVHPLQRIQTPCDSMEGSTDDDGDLLRWAANGSPI